MMCPENLPAPLATTECAGNAPEEIGIASELVQLEQELANHEAAAQAIRKRMADLAPHVEGRFGDILRQQAEIDDWLADPQFDAVAFAKQMRRKVDQVRYVVEDLMPKRSGGLAEAAKPIVSKAAAIKNNRERLRAAIVEEMKANHFDRVPGIVWAVRLRDSNPALEIKGVPADEATADVMDYSCYPGYVRRESVYSWNVDRIRAELKAGQPMPVAEVIMDQGEPIPEITHVPLPARLTRGSWPEFVPALEPQLEAKPKKQRTKKK